MIKEKDFACFLEYLRRTYKYNITQIINVVANSDNYKAQYYNEFKKEMEK